MMKKLILLLGMLIAMPAALPLSAVPVNAARKAAAKAVSIAAKRSGRALTPAARIAMEEAACKAFAQYGDDVFRVLEKGGLEALKQGERHGKDFWKLCSRATPQAARSLALHADTLMPIARRVGKDFVTLEGKVPGLGAECMKLFGEKSAKTLAHAPAGEITQLVGYARRADSPQTAKLLHEAYQKSGGQVLKHLNWKHIMAGGLSIGAVVTAYKLSGGIAELAENHPEQFGRIIGQWTWPVPWVLLIFLALILWPIGRFFFRTGNWICSKIPQPEQGNNEQKDKTVPEQNTAGNVPPEGKTAQDGSDTA